MNRPDTLDDVKDAILWELTVAHPQLSFEEEARLKKRLLVLMADSETVDHAELAQRFRNAIGGRPNID